MDAQRDPKYPGSNGTQYITFYYMAQIPHDAVREINTGSAEEQDYKVHLLTWDEAQERLAPNPVWQHRCTVQMARRIYESRVEYRSE